MGQNADAFQTTPTVTKTFTTVSTVTALIESGTIWSSVP